MQATMTDPRAALAVCERSVEFRATDQEPGDGRTLEGYAAVFDQPATIDSYEGTFEEVVKRGAFRKTLRERTPVMQFDHGNDKRTGSTPIGSIKDIREDDEGLFVRARLFDNELVEPIRQAVEGQAIRGMSFKFRVMAERWIDADGKRLKDNELAELLEDPGDRGPIRREITEVELFELGPVVFPAYTQTSVGVRSRFDPASVAVRGVIAQFGLDVRCIRRHLAVFGAEARQALAAEIAETFPELAQVLAQRAATPREFMQHSGSRADDFVIESVRRGLRTNNTHTDLTGRPGARSAGGGDRDAEPSSGLASPVHNSRQRLDDGALRLRGITK